MTATLAPAPNTDIPASPDLSIFFWMHRAMRRDSRRLVATLDGAVNVRRARGLVRWFERFQQVLEHHHEIEDEFYWPALVAADPTAADLAEAMLAEHHQLDTALTRTRNALAALVAGGAADADRRGALTAACGLRDILATHLDHEEGETLPRFAATPVDEFEALHERAMKSSSMRVSAIMAPFVVRYLSDDEFAQLRAQAPAILFVLNRYVWGPQDARITRVLVPAA